MIRSVACVKNQPKSFVRSYLTSSPSISSGDVQLESRPKKKIAVGKARPAIYHKFDTLVELSDGSVIVRRSQFPKAEMRMINDQRNSPLWNPSRSDLSQVNERAAGRLSKFKQKYSLFSDLDQSSTDTANKATVAEAEAATRAAKEQSDKDVAAKENAAKSQKKTVEEDEEEEFGLDDYLALVGENVKEVQSGGKLAVKKKSKK